MLLSSTRKFFIAVFVCAAVSASAFGQGCVIDTNNFELLSPTSENLPCIERNVPYSATIQIFAIPSIAFDVDSYLITTFLNLPSGITYSKNPASGKFYPADHGCVLISGTTTDPAGIYEVDYNGTVYLHNQGAYSFDAIRTFQPGILPQVSLKVIEEGALCRDTVSSDINDLKGNGHVFSVYPNPTSGVFEVKINSDDFSRAEISVADVTGRIVYTPKSLEGDLNSHVIVDLSGFPKGLYLVQVRSANRTVSKNISVE